MKILLLTTHLNIGGVSTYVVTLAKQLKSRGIDVMCASAGGTLIAELERNQIKHVTIPIRTKNELHLKLIFAFLKIIEIIDKEEITHVHAHTRVAQILGALVQRVRSVYGITTCHGFYKQRLLRRLFPAWGDTVIAISDPVREYLVNDCKVPKSKIMLVYNGVESEKFNVQLTSFDKEELRRYYSIGMHGIIIGGVSRLEKVKGYQSLIRGIPAILKRHPLTKFVLFGDGKYKKKLIRLARRLGVDDKIIFAGRVEDVGVALELVDIFVHPCTWREGFGLAVLEAMAAGKPVIVSNVGGVYALVKEGVNGWLLPPGDVTALAQAIIKLIDNPDLMHTMGMHSKSIAHELFSMDRMASEIVKVYTAVAEEKPLTENVSH